METDEPSPPPPRPRRVEPPPLARPEVVEVEVTDRVLRAEYRNHDPDVPATVRRAILESVETLAIDRVRVIENRSSTKESQLVHTLGLVPLVCDAFYMNGRCGPSTLRYTLDVTGPCVVTSAEHLRPSPDNAVHAPPAGGVDDVVLCRLDDGQRLRLECVAEPGIGAKHAKWAAASAAVFRVPRVVVPGNGRLTGHAAVIVARDCLSNVFDIENGGALLRRPQLCTMCGACVQAGVRAEPEPRLCRLEIHSTGRFADLRLLHAIAFGHTQAPGAIHAPVARRFLELFARLRHSALWVYDAELAVAVFSDVGGVHVLVRLARPDPCVLLERRYRLTLRDLMRDMCRARDVQCDTDVDASSLLERVVAGLARQLARL